MNFDFFCNNTRAHCFTQMGVRVTWDVDFKKLHVRHVVDSMFSEAKVKIEFCHGPRRGESYHRCVDNSG